MNTIVRAKDLLVIAHRGASHEAPENTLAAFNLAWQQGADGIEGDFHLTKDGNIVCIHDASTQRTAGQAMKVADATLAELRLLDVGSWKGTPWRGACIPTLDEVLATVPEGKYVFIEIKCGPEIVPALKKALAMSKVQREQVVVIAFSAQVVAETKQQIPGLKALLLIDFKTDQNTGAVSPSASEILATLEKIGADLCQTPAPNSRSARWRRRQFLRLIRKLPPRPAADYFTASRLRPTRTLLPTIFASMFLRMASTTPWTWPTLASAGNCRSISIKTRLPDRRERIP
jgi:glycerophosphoryl diester phosphodiesterase